MKKKVPEITQSAEDLKSLLRTATEKDANPATLGFASFTKWT